VPHFVPTLHQEPSHLVAMGEGSKSPVLVRQINTIANLLGSIPARCELRLKLAQTKSSSEVVVPS
jgi:hypothetical protein